jgi:acyl-CoA thioesterase I
MNQHLRRHLAFVIALVASSCGSKSDQQVRQAAFKKAWEQQLLTDFADLARYRAADEAMPAPSESEIRVVFMGDSLTENWNLAEYFPGKAYVNRGISAQTSPQMLVRFHQDVVGLKPKVVVILAGTNDIAENTGKIRLVDTENNLRSMSDLARANGINVVLCSLPPAQDFWWHKGLDPSPKIKALNDWIRTFAAERRFPFVDYYSALVDEQGGFRADLTPDGVHPSGKGYAVMKHITDDGVEAALEPIVPQKHR